MRCTHCSREVKPVIGLDIDGTLARYHEAVEQHADLYMGRKPAVGREPWDGEGNFEDYLGLTQAEYRAVKLAYRQGGNKRWIRPYAGAREFIEEMQDAGAEVWVATTRPYQRLDNIDPDTQEWLHRLGVEVDGLLYGDDKYIQLMSVVDKDRIIGIFDDLAVQIDNARAIGLPAFQVHRPHNRATSERREPGGSLSYAATWGRQRIDEWRMKHDS